MGKRKGGHNPRAKHQKVTRSREMEKTRLAVSFRVTAAPGAGSLAKCMWGAGWEIVNSGGGKKMHIENADWLYRGERQGCGWRGNVGWREWFPCLRWVRLGGVRILMEMIQSRGGQTDGSKWLRRCRGRKGEGGEGREGEASTPWGQYQP